MFICMFCDCHISTDLSLSMKINMPPEYLFPLLFRRLHENMTSYFAMCDCFINSQSISDNQVSTNKVMLCVFISSITSLWLCFHRVKPLMFQVHSLNLTSLSAVLMIGSTSISLLYISGVS